MITFREYALEEWPWSAAPVKLTPEQEAEKRADAEKLWLLRNDYELKRSANPLRPRPGGMGALATAAVFRELQARKIIAKWKDKGGIKAVKPEDKKGWLEKKTGGILKW
jgi:hypothetical protein